MILNRIVGESMVQEAWRFMLKLARKNGISGEIEETMEMRLGESERSELRSVPSMSEQMALKVMDDWIENY